MKNLSIEQIFKLKANILIVVSFISLFSIFKFFYNEYWFFSALALILSLILFILCTEAGIRFSNFRNLIEPLLPYYININSIIGFPQKTIYKIIEDTLRQDIEVTEKKYKIIMLLLWLNDRMISYKISDFKEKIDEYFNGLFENNEIKSKAEFSHYTLNGSKLLEDDINQLQKFKIAQKVYEQYSHLAMGARALITGDKNLVFFMQLQNFTFTKQDLSLLKRYTKFLKSKKSKFFVTSPTYNVTEGNYQALISIFPNIEDKESLMCSKNFLEIFMADEEEDEKKELENILNIINAKLNYQNFNEELINKKEVKTKLNKL